MLKKSLGFLAVATAPAFAAAPAYVSDVETAISDAGSAVTTILSAGVAIVGLFLAWKVVRRAANKI